MDRKNSVCDLFGWEDSRKSMFGKGRSLAGQLEDVHSVELSSG